MDKKNKKHILRWLAASMCAFTVTSLTGCAEEVSNLFGGNRGEVEVTASFNEPGKAVTRAHDGLNGTSGFTLTTEAESQSKVRVMVDQNDGTYSEYDYDITGATTINRDSKPTFPSGESSVNVYGWYPAKSLENFTVAADQKGNTGYCLSDLMFANGTTCVRNLSTGAITSAANLEFSHVMAKVKVNLTLANLVTVKSATFKTMKTKVSVSETKTGNAVTGYTATTDGVSTSDITLLTGGSLTNASDAADLKLCGVFPDQEKNGEFLVIVANYNSGSDQTITYSFDAAKHFVKGNEYTMNISLDGTDVTTTTVNITDWNIESGTVNIGGGGGGGDAPTLSPTSLTLTYGDAASSITASAVGTAWTALSANTSVATVSGTGPISVTPAGVGSTTVHVWPTAGVSGGFSTASCAVTVNALELQQDASGSIGYTTVAAIADQPYTGSAVTPKPAVTVKVNNGTNTLVENTDFTYSYSNNTAAGTNTATVTIVPKAGGNYVNAVGDAITKTFSITTCTGTALASATVGMIICEHGKAHTATTGALSCGGKKVAIIAYKGSAGTADKSTGSTGYVGLAIALTDYEEGDTKTWQWYTANEGTCITNGQSSTVATAIGTTGDFGKGIDNTNRLADANCGSGHVHAAAQKARAYKYDASVSAGAHPTGTSQWFLPTMYQWNLMVKAMCGGSTDLTTSTNNSYKAAGFNTKITAAGGTGVQANTYWSSVESNTYSAWRMRFDRGDANYNYKAGTHYVRPVLAF